MAEGFPQDVTSMSDFTEDLNSTLRLVLLGKTGAGKSATGNAILGNKTFASRACHTSVTAVCQSETVDRFERKVMVVDTPGFFDTNRNNKDLNGELLNFFVEAAPGPHAFVIVLSMARFTEEEESAINEIKNLFGESVFNYSILLFPKGDDLKADDVLFSDFIDNCPPKLKEIFDKCGDRVISFNNRANQEENDKQVKHLLELVEEIVAKNNGICYTNEIFEEIQREIKRIQEEENEKLIRKKQEFMSTIQREVDRKFAEIMRNDKEKLEYNNLMIRRLTETLHSSTDPDLLDELKKNIEKYREENEILSQKLLKAEKDKVREIQEEKDALEKKMKEKMSTEEKAKDEIKTTFQKVKDGFFDVANLLVIGRTVYKLAKPFF